MGPGVLRRERVGIRVRHRLAPSDRTAPVGAHAVAGRDARTVARTVEQLDLEEQAGGDLVLGAVDLAAEYARRDLIDEHRLHVHPMVIGRGTPMLRPSDAGIPLRLVETHGFDNGVVMLRCERRLSGRAGA